MRYSMNIEERVDSILETADDLHPGDFTRSHTLTDLNDVDLQQSVASGPYASGSQSTLGSDNSSRTSGCASSTAAAAKLVHTSNNPSNYSNQNLHKDSLSSPVWKPRHSSAKVSANAHAQGSLQGSHTKQFTSQQQQQQRHSDGSMYSSGLMAARGANYPSVVYDDRNTAVLLTHPNTTLNVDDTDC